jgi:hypothetical protein
MSRSGRVGGVARPIDAFHAPDCDLFGRRLGVDPRRAGVPRLSECFGDANAINCLRPRAADFDLIADHGAVRLRGRAVDAHLPELAGFLRFRSRIE